MNHKIKVHLPELDSFQIISDIQLKEIKESKHIYFKTTEEKQIFTIEKQDDSIIISVNSLAIMQIKFLYDYAMFLFEFLEEEKNNSFCYKLSTNYGFLNKQYIFTNELDVKTQLSINEIKNICCINEQRKFIHYIDGYDNIMIPAKFYDNNIGNETDLWIKNKFYFQKILSPFIKVKDKILDCRNDEFYKYVSCANGKPIEMIKETYNKFVEDCKKYGINCQ